ncbi:MAG: protein-L-isoaspartate(D-aspartate) O-methyltransferase [Chloroflexi bacterium]|nr:protein-L-isoaspartate(D-aspartate) O-methyltransferase [Chloroflexota bacterium]
MHPDNDAEGFRAARAELIADLSRRVDDERVLAAMARVPREEFVPPEIRSRAYENIALPIGDGQTISQPLIVAQMTSELRPRPGDRILELGTGSGYLAAVLSLLVSEVITVERIPGLTSEARTRLSRLGYDNVRIEQALEELGWPEGAPYDGIIVSAGAPELPLALLEQLRVGGRMVVPVGPIGKQNLLLAVKTEIGHQTKELGACAFVPLFGRGAWPPSA